MRLNNDVYVEKLVVKHLTTKDKMCKVLYVLLAVLAILIVNIFPLFFGIGYLFLFTGAISFGIGYLCYYKVSGLRKEFEYSVVNDEFTVDTIKGQKRRVQLFSGSIRDFEMVAKLKDDRHPVTEFEKPNYLRGRCVSGINKDEEWYIATSMGSQKVLLYIEPDESMLQAFFRFNPRNTMYRPSGKPMGTATVTPRVRSQAESEVKHHEKTDGKTDDKKEE